MKASSCTCLMLAAVLLGATCFLQAAACPFAKLRGAGALAAVEMPAGHPTVARQPAARKLLQAAGATFTPSPEYIAAFKALITDFETVLGNCQFSLEGMAYNNNTIISVNSPNVFMPAASWLRAFFHDAGTHSKKGGVGGPNGSLGVGCPNNTCATLGVAVAKPPGFTCSNGAPSIGGFTDGLNYCCPEPSQCIVQTQSANSGATPGLVVPGCLDGSAATVELCRRENDGLVPTIQFFRGRQNTAAFQYDTPEGKKKLSLADIIVAGGVTAVKQCSGQQLVIDRTIGRVEATVADTGILPSPNSIIDQQHFEVFQRMGLTKIDMVTLVTGSHSIGGFRTSASGALTQCPYTPFDCTPSHQISGEAFPFDNQVFKLACNGVQGVTTGTCAWSQRCTNPAVAQPGCPFEQRVRDRFAACGGYPAPGLSSDIFLCNEPSTKGRMVKYAKDQDFFFTKYRDLFSNMANLGYADGSLTVLV